MGFAGVFGGSSRCHNIVYLYGNISRRVKLSYLCFPLQEVSVSLYISHPPNQPNHKLKTKKTKNKNRTTNISNISYKNVRVWVLHFQKWNSISIWHTVLVSNGYQNLSPIAGSHNPGLLNRYKKIRPLKSPRSGLRLYIKDGLFFGRNTKNEEPDLSYLCLRVEFIHSNAVVFTLYRYLDERSVIFNQISEMIQISSQKTLRITFTNEVTSMLTTKRG